MKAKKLIKPKKEGITQNRCYKNVKNTDMTKKILIIGSGGEGKSAFV